MRRLCLPPLQDAYFASDRPRPGRYRYPRGSVYDQVGHCPLCRGQLFAVLTAAGPAWRCECNVPPPPAPAVEVVDARPTVDRRKGGRDAAA